MLHSRTKKVSELTGIKKAFVKIPPLQPCVNTVEDGEPSNLYRYLGWVGAALVILGYYLNANKFAECWPVWIIGNILVALDCYRKSAYPAASMSIIITVMNVYGYLSWIK